MKKLCIYHGNCADGFGAAWCVRHALGDDVEFFAGVYGEPPPDVTGRYVIMVDFSYKRPVMLDILERCDTLLVLDHHKTARDDLADLPSGLVIFDMERSGAGMTWDHFHPDRPRPSLINHIEDRDLWRFKLPGTREIQAAVFSYPYDFDIWDKLMDGDPQNLIGEGAAIERKHHKDIAELVAVTKRRMVIGGHEVWAANLPYTLTSDAGNLMAQGEPFAACYWDTPKGRVFSLRSTADGLNVSEIAKSYGGGGHKNASGFQIPLGQPMTHPTPHQGAEPISENMETLCKLYLELANVVPKDCISSREIQLGKIADRYGLALMMIAEGAADPSYIAKSILARVRESKGD